MWRKFFLRIVFIVLPFLLTLPSVFYLLTNSLTLYPNPRFNGRIESFKTPNSLIHSFTVNHSQMALSYALREKPDGRLYPYCSIVIWLAKENEFLDISKYDHLVIETEKSTPENMVVFLKTFEQGVSKNDRQWAHSLRHNEYTLFFDPAESVYKISINDFITQDWWFKMWQIKDENRVKETYKNAVALDLQFIHRGKEPPDEAREFFSAGKIAFYKSYPGFFIFLNIFSFFYIFFLLLIIIRSKRRWGVIQPFVHLIRAPLKEIKYKPLKLENYADTEFDRLCHYIESHYNDPSISSTVISNQTGIPRSHISALIKTRCDCTCKQLINQIRITEAKRLLKITDRRILEIALEVGFNDISTFNRCFKKVESLSPRQFRNNLTVALNK